MAGRAEIFRRLESEMQEVIEVEMPATDGYEVKFRIGGREFSFYAISDGEVEWTDVDVVEDDIFSVEKGSCRLVEENS